MKTGVSCVMLVTAVVLAGTSHGSQEWESALERQCLLAREIEDTLAEADGDLELAKRAGEGLERMKAQLNGWTADFMRYYQMSLMLLSGRKDDARSVLCDLLDSETLAVHALMAVYAAGSRCFDDDELLQGEGLYCGDRVDELIPLREEAELVPPAAMNGHILDAKLLGIGDAYVAMGMYEEAALSYTEAILSCEAGPDSQTPLSSFCRIASGICRQHRQPYSLRAPSRPG